MDRIRKLALDVPLAVGLALAGVLAGRATTRFTEMDTDARGYALVLLAALALTVRRFWPLPVLAVCALATSGYLVLGYPYGPILVSLLVSVYTVACYLPVRRAAPAAAGALLVLMAHLLTGEPDLFGLIPGSAWVVVPFAAGASVRLTREAAARTRAEQMRRYADDERLRVAQEVHDVVAHGLAAITMQADIALHLLPKKPEQAEAALTAISRTSREALDELRVALGVVRRGPVEAADPAPAGSGDRRPAPGLARLDELVARVRESGVPVRVEVSGEQVALPAAVDLAAYRVVQESLTNVLRHAGPASVLVRLAYLPQALTVEVVDSGRSVPAPMTGGGHGIAGMRERVSALGGTVEAGPGPGGGFRVTASLPRERRS